MIIVLDRKTREYRDSFTTLWGFMKDYVENPKSKYEYIRNKMAEAGNDVEVRYRNFYLIKAEPKKGKKLKNGTRKKLKNNMFF